MKLIFFGTPLFAARILQFLLDKKISISAVVTQPDRPKGRRSLLIAPPVKLVAQQNKITSIYQPEKASDPSFIEELAKHKADLFVVAAYGQILKPSLLELPRLDPINVHASILPKYRGASPIQRAIMEGEKETGVTIMKIVEKLDAGDMLALSKVPIDEKITGGELQDLLAESACPLLLDVIDLYEKNAITYTPQDPKLVTYAKKLSSEDCQINWKRSSLEVHNQIRALSPHPGAFCSIEIGGVSKKLKIKKSFPYPTKGAPGKTLKVEKDLWVVGCGEGALSLLELQLEGKKTLMVKEFLLGIKEPQTLFLE